MSNTVIVSGRVVRYEERMAGSKMIGSLDISVPNPSKGKEDRTYSYFKVDVWEPDGTLSQALNTPKTKVLITGRLKQDSWTAKDGNKRSIVKIVASEVAVLEEVQVQQESEPEPEPEPAPIKVAPKAVQRQTVQAKAPVARRPVAPMPAPVQEEEEEVQSDVPDDEVPF